jgi:hypothetical protein
MGEDGTERTPQRLRTNDLHRIREFRQAARECLHHALEAKEPEIRAYQLLADTATAWSAWTEAERAILGAAKSAPQPGR